MSKTDNETGDKWKLNQITVPATPPHSGVCPSCGHCPHCGRGGYGTQPYRPYPWPYYGPPYISWGSITSSDSVQPWSNS